MVVLVSYDLHAPYKDYTELYEALKKIGSDRIRPLESVWIFDTTRSVEEISSQLRRHIDSDDRLLVIALRRDYGGWLGQNVWSWLNNRKWL